MFPLNLIINMFIKIKHNRFSLNPDSHFLSPYLLSKILNTCFYVRHHFQIGFSRKSDYKYVYIHPVQQNFTFLVFIRFPSARVEVVFNLTKWKGFQRQLFCINDQLYASHSTQSFTNSHNSENRFNNINDPF